MWKVIEIQFFQNTKHHSQLPLSGDVYEIENTVVLYACPDSMHLYQVSLSFQVQHNCSGVWTSHYSWGTVSWDSCSSAHLILHGFLNLSQSWDICWSIKSYLSIGGCLARIRIFRPSQVIITLGQRKRIDVTTDQTYIFLPRFVHPFTYIWQTSTNS